MWEVASTDEFDAWMDGLEAAAKSDIFAKLAMLRLLGPELGRPHADTLKGSKFANLKELRANTKSKVLRVAFAFDPNRTAILLLGGNKAGVNERRFYRKLIAAADALYEKHLQQSQETERDECIDMAKSFDELLRRHTTKKIRERAGRRARELLGELLLSEIRKLAGKSQREVADALGIKQPSLSKLESQSDMQISTLERIVAALGGELEVIAKFPKGIVKIDQFGKHRPKHRQATVELQLI